jgi:hypothetical protein
MAEINSYVKGRRVRLTGTFSVLGTNQDPTTVTLKVKDPSGVSTYYTYALGQITKSATGVYYKDISLNEDGTLFYRFEGTGTVETADETFLVVEKSEF